MAVKYSMPSLETMPIYIQWNHQDYWHMVKEYRFTARTNDATTYCGDDYPINTAKTRFATKVPEGENVCYYCNRKRNEG